MSQHVTSSDQPMISRPLMWAGAVLIGSAALLGLAGSGLFGAAAVIAVQRQARASGMPPSKLAAHHWQRARTAAQVGADTWRGQVPVPAPRQAKPARVG
jgi:hypothetical protein